MEVFLSRGYSGLMTEEVSCDHKPTALVSLYPLWRRRWILLATELCACLGRNNLSAGFLRSLRTQDLLAETILRSVYGPLEGLWRMMIHALR